MKAISFVSILTVGVAATLPFRADGQPIEWSVASGGNGHFYEAVLVPGGLRWDQARDAAAARGGYLVSITSAAENEWVFSLVDHPSFWSDGDFGPWLGGFQPAGSSEPAGDWQWVSGEAWSYTNWQPNEPSNGGASGPEDYLHFLGRDGVRGSGWNDQPIGGDLRPIRGYVAEYIPTPGAVPILASAALLLARRKARRQ